VSRVRSGIALALLAALVAGGAFVVALGVLDDGAPDAPPDRSAGDEDDGTTTEPPSSTTAGPPASVTPAGALETPAWILVVASESEAATAEAVATEVAEAGHPSGVLRSDDHPSMNPGFWVAYAGPYSGSDEARADAAELEADGWTGVYVRCAGTVEECGGGGSDEDADDD